MYTTKPATDEDESQRRSAYETINYFLQVSDATLLTSLFDAAKVKLETVLPLLQSTDAAVVDDNKFVWESILDLLRALVVHQDQERIEAFVQLCLPWILGAETKPQKKAYRILEHILNAETEVCAQHVRNSLKRIVKLFGTSRDSVKSTSRAARLRSLARLADLLLEQQEPTLANRRFLASATAEAVAGIKEVGEKARTAATTLLVRVGNVYKKWAPAETRWLNDYMTLIMKVKRITLASTKFAFVESAVSFESERTSMQDLIHCFTLHAGLEVVERGAGVQRRGVGDVRHPRIRG